jgi:hypothetical protein
MGRYQLDDGLISRFGLASKIVRLQYLIDVARALVQMQMRKQGK